VLMPGPSQSIEERSSLRALVMEASVVNNGLVSTSVETRHAEQRISLRKLTQRFVEGFSTPFQLTHRGPARVRESLRSLSSTPGFNISSLP